MQNNSFGKYINNGNKNNVATTNKPRFSVAIKSDAYQNLINSSLGDKEVARKFVAEISSVVSINPSLSKCDAGTILSAGLLAQSLNLPLAPSLGFCYLVPYGDKAQFQMGYKGLVQLAQRSGQFKKLGVRPVHEGEYAGQDEFGDDLFNFSHEFDNNKTIGYFAYFRLLNGFEKTMYWTVEQVQAHAKKYSKTYGSTSSTNVWRDNEESMSCKTVLKLLINRYAPMSVEMQKAIQADQSVINQDGTYSYVDNPAYEEEQPKKPTTRKPVSNSLIQEELEEKEEENFDDVLPFDDMSEEDN